MLVQINKAMQILAAKMAVDSELEIFFEEKNCQRETRQKSKVNMMM